MSELPPDPLTALGAQAAALHELYRAFLAAGFTDPQAMQLLVAILQKP